MCLVKNVARVHWIVRACEGAWVDAWVSLWVRECVDCRLLICVYLCVCVFVCACAICTPSLRPSPTEVIFCLCAFA